MTKKEHSKMMVCSVSEFVGFACFVNMFANSL